MLDATGKLPPGVVKGNIQWLGNYRECINGAVPGFSHYCSVAIGGTLQVCTGILCQPVVNEVLFRGGRGH